MKSMCFILLKTLCALNVLASSVPRDELEFEYGRATHVFECAVRSLGDCSEVYSGLGVAFQPVSCSITRDFKGSTSMFSPVVMHEIVRGERFIERTRPCLDSSKIHTGDHLIFFATANGGKLESSANGIVKTDATVVQLLEGWGRCHLSESSIESNVVWRVTGSGDLVTSDGTVDVGVFGHGMLARFLGADVDVKRVVLAGNKLDLAIELAAPDVEFGTVVLGDVRNKCPLRQLQPSYGSITKSQGVFEGQPRSPIWLDGARLAFLVAVHDEFNHKVFIQDLDSDTMRVLDLPFEPLSVHCYDNQMVVRRKTDLTTVPMNVQCVSAIDAVR